jgi:tRNA-specific 2-thiouridylase
MIKQDGSSFLKKGKDAKKSQEYFLSLVKPSVLRSLIFPLGGYTKDEVKKIAKDKKILFKERRESQDVCFVKDKYYPEFIEENTSGYTRYRGDIRHLKGKLLGQHKGIYQYTYGQRGGLGISWPKPLYVIAIDGKTKEIAVGEKEFLYKDTFSVHSLNWFISPGKYASCFCLPQGKGKEMKNIKVKVRYNSPSYNCSLKFTNDKAVVELSKKIDSVAPGQIAAFYYKDILLGGGIISKS